MSHRDPRTLLDKELVDAMGSAVLARAGVLTLLAAVVGAAAGWIGALALDDEMQAARLSGRLHLTLFVVLPLGWLTLRKALQRTRGQWRRQPEFVVLVEGVAGLLGSLGANLIFFLLAVFVPFVFAGKALETVRTATWEEIGWLQMGALVLLTVVFGIIVGRGSTSPGRGT